MDAAIGSSGLAPPLADGQGGALDVAAGMAVDDGGGQQSEELRDQALGLISDAQTAGDRREKEALLKQVEELVLHRAPGLLDEVVPTLIAEFQVDPAPGVRKVLAEFLENVVKAHPSFCQPGMVDVYAHALQYDDSPLVVKRVLVAATNVHRVVLRYAAHSGLAQIWADYCRRVKAPVLAMRDDPVRMADPGIAQGVMKFLEGCIFTGSAPARSSAVASRADDSFTVADLAATYDAQTQELFGVEGMRQEAQALLGQSLLGWLSRGHEGFKAPHWSFLINTLSSIATHRVQFLPLIAGTLGGLLAARFAPFSSEGEEETHGQHLRPLAVTQVLKSACLKLARLPATRSHPLALEALAKGLKVAGMEAELKALGPHMPDGLRARLLAEGKGGKGEEEGTTAEEPASKRPPRGGQEASASASSAARDPRQQRQREKEQEAVQEEESKEVVVPPELLAVPPHWYKTNAPERAAFVLASLAAVPLPPAPFRDARLVLQDPDALVLRLANDLTGGQPQQSLGFFAEVAAGSRQEGPMEVSGGGLGNEALTELILETPGSDDDENDQRPSSVARNKAATLKGSGVIGEETLTPEQWGERRRLQEVGAVDRMLWRAEGAVDDFGAGQVRVAMVARVLCLLGGSAERSEGGEGEEVIQEGPTLPQQQVEGVERTKKANVAAIAALASTQGAIGHALSYLVEDYGSRKELADRLLYELFLRGLMEQEERGGEEEPDADATAAAGEGGETDANDEEEEAIKKRRLGAEVEKRRLRKGMELYDTVFVALCRRLVGRLDGRDKDKLLTSAYLSAPRTPTRALDLLSECLADKTGNRMMQGLMTLVELAVYRPMVQEDCLARVLQAAIHTNADVRRNAIQKAILKKLYRIEELKAGIEGFARAQLDSALQPPAPAPSSTRSSKRSKTTEASAAMTKEEEEEDVKRRIYLYLSLCAKNEALVGGVFETYAAASSSAAKGEARGAVVKGVLEGEMDAFVKHVVVPHGPGAVLSSLVGAPPLASPLILLVLNLLAPETQARPRPPAPEVVAAAKSLRELRGGDVAYLLPVLGGLTRQEMEKEALPPLMEQDLVDERLLKRMIAPYGPLSHADALVALHNVDPEQAKIPLKKYLGTLQKCLGMKALFPQTALTLALVKMVEDKATPVPYAYMRSVILAIRTYPGLKAAVADAVVPKLVEREIWATQPRVWEGMVLLPKYVGAREVTDKMAEALLLLPAPQLQDLIKKNPDMRAVLVAHVTRAKKQAGLDAAKRKALGL